MTHQLSLSNTSPGDWRYVAEGGASIVFSYTGPADHRFGGTVLRLRKATHDFVKDSAAELLPTKDVDDLFIPIHQRVMLRLVPEGYLPQLRSARVEREWLMRLDQLSANQRPLDRLRTDRIDISRHNAILVADLVGTAEWTVEIKVCIYPIRMNSHHTSCSLNGVFSLHRVFCPSRPILPRRRRVAFVCILVSRPAREGTPSSTFVPSIYTPGKNIVFVGLCVPCGIAGYILVELSTT